MFQWILDHPKESWLGFLIAILWVVGILHFLDKNRPKKGL